MANCSSYQKLTTVEKVTLIGELIHCIQSDEYCLLTAKGMVNAARRRGVLDNVQILPERVEENSLITLAEQ
jgi:hypothetical protein